MMESLHIENHPYARMRQQVHVTKTTSRRDQNLTSRIRQLLARIRKPNYYKTLNRRQARRHFIHSPILLPGMKFAPIKRCFVHENGWGAICYTARESLRLEREVLPLIGVKKNLTVQFAPQRTELLTENFQQKPVAMRPMRLMLFNQIHTNALFVARNKEVLSYPCDNHAMSFPKADGVVAAITGAAFVIRTADCIPLFFFDPNGKAWGALHVSWRSLQAGILQTAFLTQLPLQFATTPSRLSVYLGPSIMKCCYPVGREVISMLTPSLKAYNIAEDRVCTPVSDNGVQNARAYLDLPELCTAILVALGVRRANITRSKDCTACHGGYFSYRSHRTRYRNWNIVFKSTV
ncbi:laccase domain protein [Spirochaetota bacterium]|nr:laccase domain protein [Spirochaetota bacterium]